MSAAHRLRIRFDASRAVSELRERGLTLLEQVRSATLEPGLSFRVAVR